MKRSYIIIVLSFILSRNANAQHMGLNIGEQVPDLEIPKMINAAKKSARITEFKEQLLILDFWGTGCVSCVLALPKMDSLQKKFGNRIKILPVTDETEARITSFWKINSYAKRTSLPSVVEDKKLNSLFKHKILPHEVWIYKGKLIAVTTAEYVDASNIEKVLSGAPVNWPVKNDFYVFDKTRPLFNPDPNQVNANGLFIKYAAISDYKEGVDNSVWLSAGSGIVRDPINKTIRTYFLNQPIYNSYLINWGNAIGVSNMIKSLQIPNQDIQAPNTIIWEVADKTRYSYRSQYGHQPDWLRKNAICFESVNPDTGQTDQDIARSTIANLNRLLGLNARWEKRKEKILVLIKTGNLDQFKSKKTLTMDHDNQNFPETYIRKENLHQFRDAVLYTFVKLMNQQETNPYVFDETGYKGKLDLNLSFSSWTDIGAIRKAISPYGLDLKEEERLVDRFVITEVSGGLLIDGQMQEEAKAKRTAQADMKNPSAEENKAFMELNKKKAGVVVLPSGIQYKIIKSGSGSKPNLNDKVTINYTGMLVNGKIFDSSYEIGKPAEIRLNKERVIEGWTEALPLMPAGSKWVLYVPAALAYADHTGHGTVPPNSNLIFEIELLQIVK